MDIFMKKFALAAILAASFALPAVAATKMEELKDGTKIEIVDGTKVEVVAKDGKKTPAPDATHELKDGTKVTTKGGVIVK